MSHERQFQIFTKPVSDSCNLSCSYCYYHLSSSNKRQRNSLVENDSFLKEYIQQHIEATTSGTVFFSWHGGEPMLAGIDFYKKAVELQRQFLPPGKKLLNGIQTNGTLLSDDWCQFLSDNNFIAGISIDGPGHLHNSYRKTKTGQDTFDKVFAGFRLLRQHKVTTEILCVVSACNEDYPIEVYRFFKQIGARFITFLPLVNQIDTSGKADKMSVHAAAFGRFLIAVFDEWVQNDIGKIDVQIFEEALRSAFDNEHTLCIFKQNCGGVPVIESNGDFYSCDHFVNNEFLVGNIEEHSLAELLDCKKQVSFGLLKSTTLPAFCKRCEVLKMCNGECPKNRFLVSPDGESGLNYLCDGYRMFFNHCQPLIEEIRKAVTSGF